MSALAPAVPVTAEERVSVASSWRLVWWRFRKHRLALASAFVLLALYLVVLCPDFFSTQDPEATDARLAFIPVQRVRFSPSPFVVNPYLHTITEVRKSVKKAPGFIFQNVDRA